MHSAVITTKDAFLNQWEVVNCRVHVGDVIGDLDTSQAASWKAKGRFEEKSEGGNCTTHSQVGYLSRVEFRLVLS